MSKTAHNLQLKDFVGDADFNRSNNEDPNLPIQTAGVSRGRNGFKKDKSGEKLAESEEDLYEHRTDGIDAFDTLYIDCEKFLYPPNVGRCLIVWAFRLRRGDNVNGVCCLRHSAYIPNA